MAAGKALAVRAAVLAVALAAVSGWAAPNGEVTVIPLGGATVKSGVQTLSFRLAAATQGQDVLPLVFISAQPYVELAPAPPLDSSAAPEREQVPATISIESEGRKLPDFVLTPEATAYVISAETIRGNPEFESRRLALTLRLDSPAEQVSLIVLGMPDAHLLGAGADGPLLSLAGDAAGGEEVRRYFEGLSQEIAGDQQAALAGYRALSSSARSDVARLARRGRRMLEYQTRERKLSGNFLEHYRWGLYLQFCGLYRAAFEEFEECRIIHAPHAEAQYRAGECQALMNGDLMKILMYVDRTEEHAPPVPQTVLKLMVVAIRQRDGAEALTDATLNSIADNCLIAQKLVAAATSNAIRLEFTIPIVDDAAAVGLAEYVNDPSSGGTRDHRAEADFFATAEDLLDPSAHTDGMIVVMPRRTDEPADSIRFTRRGPHNAAIASVYADGGWQTIMEAAYRMIKSAGAAGTLPTAEDALAIGYAPSPHIGYSCQAALHYGVARNSLLGIGFAEEPVEESFVQLWRLVKADGANMEGTAAPFKSPGPASERTVVIDGRTVAMPDGGAGAMRATSWIYVPRDQIAQLRIDSACQTSLWVNGRRDIATPDRLTGDGGIASAFAGIWLQRGWNRLDLNCWGCASDGGNSASFALSLLTPAGKPIPGLAQSHTLPDKNVVALGAEMGGSGGWYRWSSVQFDWQRKLPVLDLAQVLGVPGVTVKSRLEPRAGFIAVSLPGHDEGPGYRVPPANWDSARDRDVVFNNLMDWHREWCLGVQTGEGDAMRTLLLVRPPAVEAILFCLKEADGANEAFGGRELPDRVLGRVVVPADGYNRELIAFDLRLGDAATWPRDEEDLLTPFGPFIPNSIYIDPVGPPAPLVAD